MDRNKIAIESLSMDLLRVALGHHRGSVKMAERFSEEALRWVGEIDREKIKPYFVTILEKLPQVLSNENKDSTAEDALMYSTLCRNYSLHYC